MIDIITSLLTPALLATSPMNEPAPTIQYDWHSQTASAYDASGAQFDVANSSLKGTQSYVGKGFIIDDFNSD